MRTRLQILIGLLFVFLLAGCNQVQKLGGNMQSLFQLRFQLTEKFGYRDVTVTLMNGNHLQIGVMNASVNAGPGLREKALDMARFTYSKYPSRVDLKSVGVSFVNQRSFLVLHFSNVVGTFTFKAPDQLLQ